MQNLQIIIKQEDIDNGQSCEPNSCPFALAVRRAAKTDRVEVGVNDMLLNGKSVPLPAAAMQFIASFDCDDKVFPTTFTLHL